MDVSYNVLGLARTISDRTNTAYRTYLADGTLAMVGDGTVSKAYLGSGRDKVDNISGDESTILGIKCG